MRKQSLPEVNGLSQGHTMLRGGAWIPSRSCLTADHPTPSAYDHLYTGSAHKGNVSNVWPGTVHPLAVWPFPGWWLLTFLGLILCTCSSLQLCLQTRIQRGWKPLFRNGPLCRNYEGGLQPKCECSPLFPGYLVS